MKNVVENLAKNDKYNYVELKSLMQKVILAAEKVIVECEKEKPNGLTISNLAIERMDKLREKIEMTIFWECTSVYEANRGVEDTAF